MLPCPLFRYFVLGDFQMTQEDNAQLAAMTAQELQEAIGAGLVTVADAMQEMSRRQESKDAELAAAKAAAKGNGRTIKANNSGGLFIRDTSFKCWSEDKTKEYTGCINADPDLFRALVNNSGLLDDIRDYLKISGLTKFPRKGHKPVAKIEQPKTELNYDVASQLTTPGPLAGKVKK